MEREDVMERSKIWLWIVLLVAVVVVAPAASALPRLDVDCYTWTLEVCSNGSCSSQTCEQCDFWVAGIYIGSTGGCGG
jgi:hypothetical protein